MNTQRFLSRSVFLCFLTVFALLATAPAHAWPDKSITIFVGWTAGGSSDITSRALAAELEKELGKRILVTNVNGAHGSIAATQVMRSRVDGYRWFGGAAVQGPWRVMDYTKVSWTDFYAFLTVTMPSTIYVKADAPWQTIKELIDDIKSQPSGKIKYGHPGVGSNGHIFAGLVLTEGGVVEKVRAIPYGGGRDAGRFLLSGQIQFASVTMGDLTDYASAGRIRPLANLHSEEIEFDGVTYAPITKAFPQLKPYQAINPYYGVYVPRNVSEEVVITIAKAYAKAIKQPSFKKLAVYDRAGILSPRVGMAADQQMSKITSARSWALQNLGIAKKNPASFNIPTLKDWTWPPNDAAAGVKPWPSFVEQLATSLK